MVVSNDSSDTEMR